MAEPHPGYPRILVLSRNYPNSSFETLGLWVEQQVRACTRFCDARVIAPVPYAPPFPFLGEYYARFRRIASHERRNGVEVLHPRYLLGPGYSLHNVESLTYYLGVQQQVNHLRQFFGFDVIHAHFIYPDAVVAAWLGRQYHVPVIITEHAPWRPWLDNYPIVRRQAIWAARQSAFLVAPSQSARASMSHYIGNVDKLQVIPNLVDGDLFTLRENSPRNRSNQLLFIGQVRPVKGLDVLLQAMRSLATERPQLRLVVAGESFYQSYRAEYERLQRLAAEWGLGSHVQFVGKKVATELVSLIHSSDLLILPSRAESLGVVLIEALACGVPVVATRCGGPEDIVTDQVGLLVPPEDAVALAEGIKHVLDRLDQFDPEQLRMYALEHFGQESVARRIANLYEQAIGRPLTLTLPV